MTDMKHNTTPYLLNLDLQFFSEDPGAGTQETSGGYPSLEQVQQYQQSLDETGASETPQVNEEAGGGGEHSTQGQESTPDNTHRIKWNGEEREMTYEELVSAAQQGYDYTQKSQQLAQQREQLQGMQQFVEFVNSDPRLQQDLLNLMSQYDESQQQAEQVTQQPSLEQNPQFQQMQQQMDQFQTFLHQQEVEKETSDLYSKFPDAKDLNKEELYKFADDNGVKLEQAYKLMTYDKLPERTKEQMVQQNMKKKISHTQPVYGNSGGQEIVNTPKSYADIRQTLASGNYKLFQD